MDAKERWVKVARLIDEVREDEKLKITLQKGSEKEKIEALETRGFSEDERRNLKEDLLLLTPEVSGFIIFWL
jgi:hypothetical protein